MTSQRTTPHSESKFTQQAILSGICDNKDLDKAWDKKKGSLYKCSKLLPNFPGSQCRTQPDILENRWERVYGIQATLNCSDTMLAFMIKETANRDSELYQTLEHLKHTDGSLYQQGLGGVKKTYYLGLRAIWAPHQDSLSRSRSSLLEEVQRKT